MDVASVLASRLEREQIRLQMVVTLSHAPIAIGPGLAASGGQTRVTEDLRHEEPTAQPGRFRLWSDDPAKVDLLAFSAISVTIVDALFDEDLDPLAIGLSGSWGGGKTTVLRLIEQELKANTTEERAVLVVSTEHEHADDLAVRDLTEVERPLLSSATKSSS